MDIQKRKKPSEKKQLKKRNGDLIGPHPQQHIENQALFTSRVFKGMGGY
jgi:hypothetical protein